MTFGVSAIDAFATTGTSMTFGASAIDAFATTGTSVTFGASAIDAFATTGASTTTVFCIGSIATEGIIISFIGASILHTVILCIESDEKMASADNNVQSSAIVADNNGESN